MSPPISQLYRFGDFILDADQRVLLSAGKPVALTPKVFDTLLLLVENRGRIVEKDELMRRLWPATFVEETNITFNIKQLRKCLRDNARKPRYVETVARRGYRFIAEVETVFSDNGQPVDQTALSKTLPGRLSAGENAVISETVAQVPTPNGTSDQRFSAGENQISLIAASEPTSRWLNKKTIALGAATIIILAAAGVAFWKFAIASRSSGAGKRVEERSTAASPLKLEKLTVTGQSSHAAISPDGKYVAYTRSFENKTGIWLRQLASNTNVEIVPAGEAVYGLAFTHGGEYLYFVRGDPTALFRVPSFGGVPTRLIDSLEGNFSISADDAQIALIRQSISRAGLREYSLITARSDGTGEHQIFTGTHPYQLDTPLWSADGGTITCAYGNSTGGTQNVSLIEVRVADGVKKELSPIRFFGIQKLALLPDGNGLILLARKHPEDNNQVWRISYPGMEVSQISEGVISYGDLSLTASADKAAASQMTRVSDIWVGSSREPKSLKRITQATDAFGWTPSGQLVYSSTASGNRDVWIMQPDGTTQRQLTVDPAMDGAPTVTADGRYIVFVSYRSGTFQVWRMNLDGSDQIQLTKGAGKTALSTSPDGKWVFYNSTDDWNLWKVSIDGGEPVHLTDYPAIYSSVSPDGKMIACAGRNQPKRELSIFILPLEGGQPLKRMDVPGGFAGSRFNWTRDSRAVIYMAEKGGRTSVLKWALGNSSPEEIATLNLDQLFDFGYSPDGQLLAVTRDEWRHDIVLISDLNR